MKTYKELKEQMAANSSTGGGNGTGIAGMHSSIEPLDDLPQIAGREADRLAIKPRKKKKNESFAGCPVFTVSNDDYAKCMHGRMRYERWNKKLNMEEIDNQEIRTYAHRNPGKPIIVKDETYGTMSYFVPPKNVNESVELDEDINKMIPGKVVAKRMMSIKSLKPYAAQIAKMKNVNMFQMLKVFVKHDEVPMKDIEKVMKESVELDEVLVQLDEVMSDREMAMFTKAHTALHTRMHKQALQIIKFIDSVEKHKDKWTDSFGDYVKPKMNPELKLSSPNSVEYQQGRGRGDWSFLIGHGKVRYNNKNMPWMPKSGELPFDKFMKLLDTWKKETLRESVELDEDNTAAIAKQVKQAVKKYTTGKLTVKSKGGKTRFIMVMADKIDNKLRKMILDIAYPKANVNDKSNISYGNISDKIISVSADVWVKALTLKESVEEGATTQALLKRFKMRKFDRDERKRKNTENKRIKKYQTMVGIPTTESVEDEIL